MFAFAKLKNLFQRAKLYFIMPLGFRPEQLMLYFFRVVMRINIWWNLMNLFNTANFFVWALLFLFYEVICFKFLTEIHFTFVNLWICSRSVLFSGFCWPQNLVDDSALGQCSLLHTSLACVPDGVRGHRHNSALNAWISLYAFVAEP